MLNLILVRILGKIIKTLIVLLIDILSLENQVMINTITYFSLYFVCSYKSDFSTFSQSLTMEHRKVQVPMQGYLL